ncbi:MAG: IS200/IS605 family transposase [Bacteroidales bacterium]|jgi:REP element-mobilizing transposase RayT|nr:IS200/IS605 family transposase [Bacteroidales bacterium]
MGSYRQIIYHLTFHTKYNIPAINPEHKKELYKYIWGIIKNKDCVLFQINGVENHVHILSDLHPGISLANYIKDIKVASSVWMKETGKFPKFRGWAEGYGAFTVAYRNKQTVINYIKNQEEHHRKVSFQNEYIALLMEHGVNYDARYL